MWYVWLYLPSYGLTWDGRPQSRVCHESFGFVGCQLDFAAITEGGTHVTSVYEVHRRMCLLGAHFDDEHERQLCGSNLQMHRLICAKRKFSRDESRYRDPEHFKPLPEGLKILAVSRKAASLFSFDKADTLRVLAGADSPPGAMGTAGGGPRGTAAADLDQFERDGPPTRPVTVVVLHAASEHPPGCGRNSQMPVRIQKCSI